MMRTPLQTWNTPSLASRRPFRRRKAHGVLAWGTVCWFLLAVATLCGALLFPSRAAAQGLEIGPAPAPPPVFELPAFGDTPLVAKVDGTPIYAGEVQQRVDKLFKGIVLPKEARAKVEAEILNQLIDARLLDGFLADAAQVVTEQDVKSAIENIQQSVGGKPSDLKEFLRKQGWSERDLKLRVSGDLGWPAYQRRMLTPERLQAYFEKHRVHYDGTEVHLAQILLSVPKDASPEESAAVLQRAKDLREQIEAGKTSFGEAAAKHSVAPSKFAGGDLGWVHRQGDLPEPVAAAAFALPAGKLGGPIVSRYGVHLLECQEIKPGKKTWEASRDLLHQAASKELFREVVEKERLKAQIERPTAP